MRSLWDPSARRELRDRLARLNPASERRWGTMSAPQMMAHLVEAMRMAQGEIVVPSKKLPIRFTPLKELILYVLPFPKGAPTAPELISRAPLDWVTECATLATMIERFGERDRSGAWSEHPAFGKLTGQQWGVLIYRHTDHHFRQFGV
jgi:hypothetical protein